MFYSRSYVLYKKKVYWSSAPILILKTGFEKNTQFYANTMLDIYICTCLKLYNLLLCKFYGWSGACVCLAVSKISQELFIQEILLKLSESN